MIQKVILIVLDSVGVGELPDAAKYGDEGSNTLGNVAKAVGGLSLPNMQKMGIGNIIDIEGVPSCKRADSCVWKGCGKVCGKGYDDWTLGTCRCYIGKALSRVSRWFSAGANRGI